MVDTLCAGNAFPNNPNGITQNKKNKKNETYRAACMFHSIFIIKVSLRACILVPLLRFIAYAHGNYNVKHRYRHIIHIIL